MEQKVKFEKVVFLILNEANQPIKMENNIVAAHIIKQDIFSHTNSDCW